MARRTPAEKTEGFAARIDAKLRQDEQSSTAMRVVTDSTLRTVLQACGFKKRGSSNVGLIEAALLKRGVFADPALTHSGLAWEERIYFTRTRPSPDRDVHRVRFPAERDLETFLEANFDYLFPGLDLVDRQYRVQSGQIDMLARDRDGYVVIELKLGDPSDDLVYAVDRYMDDVANWVADQGGSETVRGLVVAARVDERMRRQLDDLARADGRRIDWMEYRVEFELRPPVAAGRSL